MFVNLKQMGKYTKMFGGVINQLMDVQNRPDLLEAQTAGERGERVGRV